MSIIGRRPHFVAICDRCGRALPVQPDFRAAVDAKKAVGWIGRAVGEDWEDICASCLREEMGCGSKKTIPI